ncbi:MAG: collagen-like protein [Flavobacteriaceae bacterium]
MKLLKYGLLIVSITLFSCSPEDGENGEIGPQGPQGIQGDPGEDGVDGTDGEDGNANVLYSEWFTVTQSDWSGIGGTKISFTQSAPDITAEITDTGVVLVYHRFNNQTRQLPYSYSPNGLHLVYIFVPGSITIEGFLLDASVISAISALDFRFIIIPGGVPIAGKGTRDFTKMSYEEVMDYFGLDY